MSILKNDIYVTKTITGSVRPASGPSISEKLAELIREMYYREYDYIEHIAENSEDLNSKTYTVKFRRR